MRLRCLQCGKSVSTEVPDGTIVRAFLQCPECMEISEKTSRSEPTESGPCPPHKYNNESNSSINTLRTAVVGT